MITTEVFNGTDKKLYKLVAPLVMDPNVLKKNNNYPFKTSQNFIWIIAFNKKKITGFFPIERNNRKAIINNYYISDHHSQETLEALISEAMKNFEEEYVINAVALMNDKETFLKYGFKVEKEWKLYTKMIL